MGQQESSSNSNLNSQPGKGGSRRQSRRMDDMMMEVAERGGGRGRNNSLQNDKYHSKLSKSKTMLVGNENDGDNKATPGAFFQADHLASRFSHIGASAEDNYIR